MSLNEPRIKISYTRLFATGNFEHMKIGLEVEVDRIKTLQDELKGLQASLPEPTEE